MGNIVTRKKFLVAVILLLAVVLIAVTVNLTFSRSKIRFSEDQKLLVLSTPVYEAAFHAKNGGIAYIKDKATGESVTSGNREQNLWWAFMDDNSSYNATGTEKFTYEWDKSEHRLTFRYESPFTVEVVIDASREERFTMQAKVLNGTERIVKSFRFPYEMRIAADQVKDALLPMLPGAKLKSTFFTENNSFEAQYPGVMFASYVAVRTAGSGLAVYDVHDSKAVPMVDVGFKNQVDATKQSAIIHNYKTSIAEKADWQSPLVVVQPSGRYEDSIQGYRADNAMDQYKGIDEKLGEASESYFESPLYKVDIAAIGRENWNTLQDNLLDKMDHTGILHLVGFQEGGHDENYPDFIPPAAKWGGEGAFKAFIAAAQKKGNKVVPYTNFSWWGVRSPTLGNLPSGVSMEDIVVKQENGTIIKEDYGPHSGYVMNPTNSFVRERTAEEHEKLLAAGFDGIFEDQWGARNAPYVYNDGLPAGTDQSTAYFAGVNAYFDSLRHKMFVEVGIDTLADDSTGFLGTNYLWDILGYRTKTDRYTEYYPMIGMLVRDKVLLYQHNLAAETMTSSKAMLRWNLAMGFNLSGDLLHGTENPWIDVAGVYQKHLLSGYVDQLVSGFEQVDDTTTLTSIGEYRITANWNEEEGLKQGDAFTLAPGGVMSVNKDATVRGGVFSRYNGMDLDPGDHYLVEVRAKDEVQLFQPNGPDTTVAVRKGDQWPHAKAAAYTFDGTQIAELPVIERDDLVQFDYIGNIFDQKVGYVRIERSEEASTVKDVPFSKQAPLINLAAGKPVVSTTDTTQDFPAAKATDGDHFTYWESMPDRFPQSLTVDLEEKLTVKKVSLTLPPLDVWEARDQEIEVLISDDGSQFTSLVPAAKYSFDPASDNRIEIPLGDANARYVRVTITSNTGWKAAQVSEFEVY